MLAYKHFTAWGWQIFHILHQLPFRLSLFRTSEIRIVYITHKMLPASCMKPILAFFSWTCFLWYILGQDLSFSWPHFSGSQQPFCKDIIPPNLFASISLQNYNLPSYIQKFLFLILLTLCYYTLSHSTTPVAQVKNSSCTFFWPPIITLLYFVT